MLSTSRRCSSGHAARRSAIASTLMYDESHLLERIDCAFQPLGIRVRVCDMAQSLFKVSLTFTHDDSANEIQPFLPQPAATSSFKSRFKHQKKRPKLTTDDGSATVGVAELAKILSAMSDAKVQEYASSNTMTMPLALAHLTSIALDCTCSHRRTAAPRVN